MNAVTGEAIGYITDPFSCCSYTFDIFDAGRNKVLCLRGSCWQCGICCPLPCGACKEAKFDITDANTGAHVGSLRKVFRKSNLFGASDAETYELDFEGISHPAWKGMLVALAMFLDMTYFTQGGEEARNNSALGTFANAMSGQGTSGYGTMRQ